MLDTLLEQLTAISPIDWFAMVMGITGVWLSIKEKLHAWPLFILCYCSYIYISFRGGYYAFGGMNIAFVGIAAYGWYQWSSSAGKAEDAVHISHLPTKHWLTIILLLITGTAAIGTLLSTTGEARLPYYDAFATCCAFIAQWMLSRKHIENWIFWIISDCVYLKFFYTDQIWPSVILFTVFIILALRGWTHWKKAIQRPTSNPQVSTFKSQPSALSSLTYETYRPHRRRIHWQEHPRPRTVRLLRRTVDR